MRIARSEAVIYRELADRYVRVTGKQVYDLTEVLRWAEQRGALVLPRSVFLDYHLPRATEALRSDTIKTPSGTRVRTRVCARVIESSEEEDRPVQRYLWAHIEDAPDELLIESFNQRLCGIRSDRIKLQRDLEYINELRVQQGKRLIQLDFTDILNDDGEDPDGQEEQ